jgi:hypothetical protein
MKWPSTTDIIKYFGLSADYEEFASDAASQRGRLVHAACHLLARNEEDSEWEARHPECHPYLDAYRKFRREHSFRLHSAEKEFRCEAHRFISHPDQIGKLDTFGSVDLELKSGSMPQWCALQTAGQILAIGTPTMPRFALLLKSDGNYKLYPHENFRDLDRFRSMVETWWTIKEFSNGDRTGAPR